MITVGEVRKNIAQQLNEYHNEKFVKKRRKEELDERIRLGDHEDYCDNDADDVLTITRRESIRSKIEWEERQCRRARTGQDSAYEIRGDNEAAIKANGKMLMRKRRHLYWSACFAHCLDLILEEIGNRKSVRRILDEAKKITSFIYNHTWMIDYMKRYTQGRELLRPGITRLATNFIIFESIVRSKQTLKEMVTSLEWRKPTYVIKPARLDMMEVINSNQFWKKAVDVIKIQEP
ncbi:hypothetical protein PVK06_034230 [Gossypium arboreum]|uniref:DUF659 domain-containing protein n=1 Tax=Gossypium arboreum TaxID=29729 RepID=A0ABR0NE69_GOSAR|nr:hypothetical protein PVK06_034230 [Gossypium arboreum]